VGSQVPENNNTYRNLSADGYFWGMWKVVEVSNDVLNHILYNDELSDIIGDHIAHTIGSFAAVAYLYFISVPPGENLHYLLRRQVRPKKTLPGTL